MNQTSLRHTITLGHEAFVRLKGQGAFGESYTESCVLVSISYQTFLDLSVLDKDLAYFLFDDYITYSQDQHFRFLVGDHCFCQFVYCVFTHEVTLLKIKHIWLKERYCYSKHNFCYSKHNYSCN